MDWFLILGFALPCNINNSKGIFSTINWHHFRWVSLTTTRHCRDCESRLVGMWGDEMDWFLNLGYALPCNNNNSKGILTIINWHHYRWVSLTTTRHWIPCESRLLWVWGAEMDWFLNLDFALLCNMNNSKGILNIITWHHFRWVSLPTTRHWLTCESRLVGRWDWLISQPRLCSSL